MNLSTQTDALAKAFGLKKAVEILADVGYEAVDISCTDKATFDTNPIFSNDYKNYAKELMKIAENGGIYFNQSHAPYPTSTNDEVYTAKTYERILRHIEFCSLLGIKNIVVHPKQHLLYRQEGNPERLQEINLEFYNSLIPYCKDYNVCVAIENMWQYDDNKVITHSTCSRPQEFKEYIDMLNSPYIVACLDLGHANLMENADIPGFIKELGDRLKCLHVHSTGYNNDLHVLPYTAGKMDWDGILKALAEINYDGELTFEADTTLTNVPDELKITTAKFMCDVGHAMTAKFEKFKKELPK